MAHSREDFAPPHSPMAEKAVLGAILRSPEQFDIVVDKASLDSKHFFLDTHRRIFSAIVELDTQNQAIDFLTVAEALSKSVGSGASEIGVPFLIELTENCPITENVEHYATIVRKYHYLRRIITAL